MIKLFIDANISWRIAGKLKDIFPGSVHVNRCGLTLPVNDHIIWEFALRNEYIILTQDEDFFNLSAVWGFPPKVVFLTTGNTSTAAINALLHERYEEIMSFAASSGRSLLEIF